MALSAHGDPGVLPAPGHCSQGSVKEPPRAPLSAPGQRVRFPSQQTRSDGAESSCVRRPSPAGGLGRVLPVPLHNSWLKIFFIFSANSAVAHRDAYFEIVCGNLEKESGCLLFTCLFIYG